MYIHCIYIREQNVHVSACMIFPHCHSAHSHDTLYTHASHHYHCHGNNKNDNSIGTLVHNTTLMSTQYLQVCKQHQIASGNKNL